VKKLENIIVECCDAWCIDKLYSEWFIR